MVEVTPVCASDPGMSNANMRYATLEVRVAASTSPCRSACSFMVGGSFVFSLCTRWWPCCACCRSPLPALTAKASQESTQRSQRLACCPGSPFCPGGSAAASLLPACTLAQVDGDAPENQNVSQQLEVRGVKLDTSTLLAGIWAVWAPACPALGHAFGWQHTAAWLLLYRRHPVPLQDGEFIQVELVPWTGLLQHLKVCA